MVLSRLALSVASSPLAFGYAPWRETGCLLSLDSQFGPGVAAGGAVANWRGRVNGCTQGTAGNQPTLGAVGVQSDGGDYMTLDAALAVNDFCAYAAVDVNGSAGNNVGVLATAGAGGNQCYLGLTGGVAYLVTGSTSYWSTTYTGGTGRVLMRYRRAGSSMFFAATGMAEVSMGVGAGTPTADTIDLAVIMARPSTGLFSTAGVSLDQVLAFAPALGTDTPADLRVRRWLLARTGLTL